MLKSTAGEATGDASPAAAPVGGGGGFRGEPSGFAGSTPAGGPG